MGNATLAQNLDVTPEEAKQFKASFSESYPKIGPFVQKVITKCQQDKYVESISHRRRPLPHINSSNSDISAKAERQAVNTQIQGSAADIIKVAMVMVEEGIRRYSLDARLVLQMHDELMYEVPLEGPNFDSYKFARFLRKQMSKVSEHLCNVTMPVKVRRGTSCGQLEEIHF